MPAEARGDAHSGSVIPGRTLKFRRVPRSLAVCQLPADAPVPKWASGGEFVSVTRCAAELSIVCAADQVPEDVKHEKPWAGFKLEGPFPFEMTGVLAAFIQPLAVAGVPIFAISTYDTDYVLVKEEFTTRAAEVLKQAGHEQC